MICKLLTFLFVIATTVAVPAQQTQPASVNAADCGCGNYSIKSDVDMVKAGEAVDFEVNTKDQNVSTNQYAWTVSAGQIVAGQGTSKIKVQTFDGMESIVTQQQAPRSDPPSGFVWSFPRKAWPTIEVSVTVIGKMCNCTLKSKDVSVGLRTMPRNLPADVTDLSLSSDHLVLPCEPGQRPNEGKPSPSKTMLIDVVTRAADPDDDPLVYVYTVSGGQIVGRGSKVQWDMKDAAPGTYTITAGVDDGCGICGKTVTRTITIEECTPSCSLPPDCPLVEIRSPEFLGSFEEYLFKAKILGGEGLNINWSVENGELIHGQGTPQIRVKTGSISTSNAFSVSLKLSGFHQFANCR